MSTEILTATLALIGVVIMVAALLSGVVERSGLPQVAVFLALGAVLGPAGFGVLNLTLDSPALRVVATLSLALVLFTDAVSLDIKEVRTHSQLASLVLGPGTILSAALIALAGWGLVGLPLAGAAILGASLASTDPVLLRGLLRRRDIPSATRQALRLESGLNDVVLLPIVLVAMEFLGHQSELDGAGWAKLILDLFVLGPGAGVLVGLIGVATLDLVRRRVGVRRDYEALYSLGMAFAAFAAAEAVHGSGFLAAFAAGLTITALDVELCDCFLEYGETTAEMALLFTFVLFGGSLIWSGLTIVTPATLVFALAAALIIRPAVLLTALGRLNLERRARWLIVWFGPRGLSSLLLVLLPVFAGRPGGEQLFALCSLAVLISVVIHGVSPMFLSRQPHRTEPPVSPSPSAPAPDMADVQPVNGQVVATPDTFIPDTSVQLRPAPLDTRGEAPFEPPADETVEPDRITLDQLRQLWARGEPVIVLDVRTERALNGSELQAKGAIRLEPDHVTERAAELKLPRDAWLIAFCA